MSPYIDLLAYRGQGRKDMTATAQSTTVPYQPLNGWNCSNCGGWVSNGTTHTCIYSFPSYSVTPPVRLTDGEIERIARRVAELLKPKRRKA